MARFNKSCLTIVCTLFNLVLPIIAAITTSSSAGAKHFNLTAIAARDGKSLFQCWQLKNPLTASNTTGITGAAIQQLGNLGAGQYGYIPAHYPGTAHPAPQPQYAIFLSGKVEISIPESDEKHVFVGGKHSFLFADDTADKSKKGHVSTILDQNSETFTLPTADGNSPPHRVLYDGVCRSSELNL